MNVYIGRGIRRKIQWTRIPNATTPHSVLETKDSGRFGAAESLLHVMQAYGVDRQASRITTLCCPSPCSWVVTGSGSHLRVLKPWHDGLSLLVHNVTSKRADQPTRRFLTMVQKRSYIQRLNNLYKNHLYLWSYVWYGLQLFSLALVFWSCTGCCSWFSILGSLLWVLGRMLRTVCYQSLYDDFLGNCKNGQGTHVLVAL
jgi:hypothetical protein